MTKPARAVCLAVALMASSDLVGAAAATYVIDVDHTKPRFSYSHFGFSTQQSRFDATAGTIVYDAKEHTASVDVTIDARSVNTGSTEFNQHIQGADFLDTTTYPSITFKSTAVHFEGENVVAVDGNLSIKGITRPVTLQLSSFVHRQHPMSKKDAIGATATLSIKRSDFNAGKYAPFVSDEVVIDIPLEARLQ